MPPSAAVDGDERCQEEHQQAPGHHPVPAERGASGGDAVPELADRVGGLSLHDAVLEVNHWCHERVTYKPSDGRTSGPLATLRTSWGRCGEESTLVVAALRAVGIPARQVYVPRWAHRDDNHAWVEAWIDGRWVTLDATPPAGDSSPYKTRTGAIGLYADWLRQRWDKYVVNYSMRMQADALKGGIRAVRRTGTVFRFRGWDGIGDAARRAAGWSLLIAPALYLLYRLHRKRRSTAGKGSPPGLPPLPGPYARLLRRLERNRFRRLPGETVEAALTAAVRRRPDLAADAARFLGLYHRDRFGPAPLPPGTREEAFRLADRLRRGIFE